MGGTQCVWFVAHVSTLSVVLYALFSSGRTAEGGEGRDSASQAKLRGSGECLSYRVTGLPDNIRRRGYQRTRQTQ